MAFIKKILVLGSEGFIGGSVVAKGLALGYDVTGIDQVEQGAARYTYRKISLLSPDFDFFLSTHSFDCIFNCAGSGNVAYSFEQPLSDFELNCGAVFFVLEAIRKYQPGSTYIHVSSAAVYGNPQSLPVSETAAILPVSPYGYHKWMAEIGCREYATLYNLPIIIVRPFSVYGPGLRKQLIWDVYQRSKEQKKVELWGTGKETRDFIYIDDLAAAMFSVAKSSSASSPAVYNIASGQSIAIEDLIKLFFKVLDWEKEIYFNGKVRQGDPRFWQADIRALQQTGFETVISLEKGLQKTANWLQHYAG